MLAVSAVDGFLQAAQGVSPVVIVVIVVVVILILLWLLLRWMSTQRQEKPVKAAAPSTAAPSTVVPVMAAAAPAAVPAAAPMAAAPVAVPPAEPAPPDDLVVIEGIGPKIASVLQAAGVTTFSQLAALAPERITEILRAAGIRLADPRSWPEQARLAAAGDRDGLKALQERLTAGRG
jgi:predicted flap endonuclease-1-like 5' DNA nuclease